MFLSLNSKAGVPVTAQGISQASGVRRAMYARPSLACCNRPSSLRVPSGEITVTLPAAISSQVALSAVRSTIPRMM